MKTLYVTAGIIGMLAGGFFTAQAVNRKFGEISAGGSFSGGNIALPSSNEFSVVTEIQVAEEEYKKTSSNYLQVIKGNTLAEGQSGTVSEKLGKDAPPNVTVDEYVAPTGPGYQIRWTDETGEHSKGFGPEAESRTWDIPKNIFVTSTST